MSSWSCSQTQASARPRRRPCLPRRSQHSAFRREGASSKGEVDRVAASLEAHVGVLGHGASSPPASRIHGSDDPAWKMGGLRRRRGFNAERVVVLVDSRQSAPEIGEAGAPA